MISVVVDLPTLANMQTFLPSEVNLGSRHQLAAVQSEMQTPASGGASQALDSEHPSVPRILRYCRAYEYCSIWLEP